MSLKSDSGPRDVRVPSKSNVLDPDDGAFAPLSLNDIREAFAMAAIIPPILSLSEAADLVKLRPQTLKRKVDSSGAGGEREGREHGELFS